MSAGEHRAAVSATGFLAENWVPLRNDVPSVILNPQADAIGGLAWCYGEVSSLRAIANIMTRDDEEIGKIFLHRLEPLAVLLEALIDRLIEDERAAAGAQS